MSSVLPSSIVERLTTDELCQAVEDILHWRDKGIMPNEGSCMLKLIADRFEKDCNIPSDYCIVLAESLVLAEAAKRYVKEHKQQS